MLYIQGGGQDFESLGTIPAKHSERIKINVVGEFYEMCFLVINSKRNL